MTYQIRILQRSKGVVETHGLDVTSTEFGEVLPSIGDRIYWHSKGASECWRVLDRIFDLGTPNYYVTMIVEHADATDIEHLTHFS